MLALIDLDIVKYSCAHALQRTVHVREDGNTMALKRVKGGTLAVHPPSGRERLFEGLYRKQDVLEAIGGVWEDQLVYGTPEEACFTTDRMVQHIVQRSGASDYRGFLSQGECFRFRLFPDYKASRKNQPKPHYLPLIEEHLLGDPHNRAFTQIEADDALGIRQCQALKRGGPPTVLCTTDKDLDMIPGWHYNWLSQTIYYVDPATAERCFWQQLLTGDPTDDIPGLKGIGKGKAAQILDKAGPSGYHGAVLAAYRDADLDEATMHRNAKLLWILRKSLSETYGEPFVDAEGNYHLPGAV